MLKFCFVLSLLSALFLESLSLAAEFKIREYRALSLLGEAGLLPDARYISFTGDFGFSRRLPHRDAIEKHVTQESALLANFDLSVINLEFMLPGNSGLELDRRIDGVVIDILKRTGYDLVSRANNHAMDLGREGFDYNTRRLQQAGLSMVGIRAFPVYEWKADGRRIVIFALTDYTDKEDSEQLIPRINASDLASIKDRTAKADFRIAFAHLGSMSFYPSPHERKQVQRILEAGADLVICTGSHFTKGFVYEKGKPVIYDIGNHIFSYVDSVTEPVGMHFVAGFRNGELVQLFVVPFHNAIFNGKTGPLDQAEFASFQNSLLDRSTSDPSKYYSDPSSLTSLKERINRFHLGKLKEMRGRHIVYTAGILYQHYPVIVVGSCLFTVTLTALFVRWTLLRHRNRTRKITKSLDA